MNYKRNALEYNKYLVHNQECCRQNDNEIKIDILLNKCWYIWNNWINRLKISCNQIKLSKLNN